MPARWTIRRAMACVSGQLRSARPSHRSDKAGGGLRCIGWMRLLRCLRPRKGGRADQRLLYEAAVSFSTTCEVHPTVVWAKLASLAEGARLATKELWGRA